MKSQRVLLLVHEDLMPPESLDGLSEPEVARVKTEYDVSYGLEKLGHEVHALGLSDSLGPLRRTVQEWKPQIAFNLLEEFHGQPVFDHNVVSYLELLHVPYTGCNPRGLILARDKALSKKIVHYHRVPVPDFAVFPIGQKVKRPKRLEFPLIVKSLIEDASATIAQASIVNTDEKLAERVQFVHSATQADAIAEQFIEGREVYVAILGNHRLSVLPIWELQMGGLPDDVAHIATEKVKFDLEYQEKHKIRLGAAKDLSPAVEARLAKVGKRIYKTLGLTGYARLDFRVGADERFYFLEANPNPDIASDEEFASAAAADGLGYPKLLDKLLMLGRRRAR